MNRREFLKTIAGLGGIALTTPWLEACTQAVPDPSRSTVQLTATPATRTTLTTEPAVHVTPTAITESTITEESMAYVAFVKTRDRVTGVNIEFITDDPESAAYAAEIRQILQSG